MSRAVLGVRVVTEQLLEPLMLTPYVALLLLMRHISSIFRRFPLLLLSYDISLRIPWEEAIYVVFAFEKGEDLDVKEVIVQEERFS